MQKIRIVTLLLVGIAVLSGCSDAGTEGQNGQTSGAVSAGTESTEAGIENSATQEQQLDINMGILNPDSSIEEIPDEYKKEAEQAGMVVRLDYQTASYENPTEMQDKYALVYLPYGYSGEQQYDILYLMHGGGGSQESSFRERQSTELKCVLDHLIANGEMKPMIVVAPTFYPGGGADSSVRTAERLVTRFPDELVNDLLPAVEGTYSSYAESTDEDGLKSSRGHRAFGGFSMGSVTTWYVFMEKLDYFRTFLPISGDCWAVAMQGGASHPEETAGVLEQALQDSGYSGKDFYIYAMTGTDDIAYEMMDKQIRAMSSLTDSFVFNTDNEDGNICFRVKEGGIHDMAHVRQYLYKMLPDLWPA